MRLDLGVIHVTGRGRRVLAGAAAMVTAALLAGGVLAAESPAPGSSDGSSQAVSIIDTSFQPADLTITAGGTVTWTVTKAISAPHSVTSGSPADAKPGAAFDSGIILRNNGDSYSHTFTTPGTYTYFCVVHPSLMSGTITVVAAGGTTGGSEEHPPVDTSTKLIAVGVLVAALVVLAGWARVFRRLNPAP
jgi:plastocyanin